MQLLDFQSNPVWKNKFVHLRAHLEDLERERSTGIASKNPDCEILKVWNSIPENVGALKTLKTGSDTPMAELAKKKIDTRGQKGSPSILYIVTSVMCSTV